MAGVFRFSYALTFGCTKMNGEQVAGLEGTVRDVEGEALEQLAGRLRRLRIERRLTMAALERRAGLGHTTVSHALNGHDIPTEATVTALARALGADSGELLALRAQAQRAAGAQPASAFDRRYRDYMVDRYGQLSITGLDLSRPAQGFWPLDTAYLSLEVSEPDDAASLWPSQNWVEPVGHAGPRVRRVEQALAGRDRTLVRGLAGSGKTTLVQWLAVCTARQQLPEGLEHLTGRIPFVLPLRSLIRHGALPAPGEFLASVGCPFAGTQPSGWADQVLAAGLGLMLIDGVDEVPFEYREDTRTWLHGLLAAYPQCCFVITTRPFAVPDGWLAGGNFAELHVRPMGGRDVEEFISRWYSAAAAAQGTSESSEEHDRWAELGGNLKNLIRMRRDLSYISTTPLMCALICALHRDRHGYLPHGRAELYRAALSMLLIRRDAERGIDAPENVRLTEDQCISLLQRLAYWLARNNQAEMDLETAHDLVDQALPAMAAVASQGDAAQILKHLVARTGLLRRPSEDTLDFIHRAFQDYLAAKAAVEWRDLGMIISNAHSDQWEDVVRMAVVHARPDERVTLIGGLVARGDQDPIHRVRLHLLAVACLEDATELGPAVRQQVENRAARLIPPRSRAEAEVLAAVGPVLLGLLPGPEDLATDEASAVVQTAAFIGGDQAMAFLKRYRNCAPASTPFEPWYHMGDSWDRFNTSDYAEQILAYMPQPRFLTVSSREQLKELSGLQPLYSISFRGNFTADEVAAHLDHATVKVVDIHDNTALSDLDFIRFFTGLTALHIYSCPSISDFSPLAGLPLEYLTLDFGYNAAPAGFTALADVSQLQYLAVNMVLPQATLNAFPAPPNLTQLSLGAASCNSCSLRGLDRWQKLVSLEMAADPDADYSDLANLLSLRRLILAGDRPLSPVIRIPPLAQVTDLWLSSWTERENIEVIPEKFPNLNALSIYCRQDSREVDLAPLAGMQSLKIHIHEALHVIGDDNFPESSIIRSPRPRIS